MKMNTLNKEYTLDNFIFGDCNKLALDTAKLQKNVIIRF